MKDCVSLDTAKKLKEAGWSQDLKVGDWYWAFLPRSKRWELFVLGNDEDQPYCEYAKAITIGELLEALPIELSLMKLKREFKVVWMPRGGSDIDTIVKSSDDNPADALALLWMALKEKGLV